MEFKVGKKYRIASKGLAESRGLEVGDVLTVTAVGYNGSAWSNEIHSRVTGTLGSDRSDQLEHYTGVPCNVAGWCLANIERLLNGEIVEVEE